MAGLIAQVVFKAGFTVLMKLESNFFTKKGHVKAMDAILPTRAALTQIIQHIKRAV